MNNTDTKKNYQCTSYSNKAGDYTKVKIQKRARIGLPGQPVAELTKWGWVVIPAGQENTVTNML